MTTRNIAVIFAAGTGERMASPFRPKQFLELRGKPVLVYTLEHFQMHKEIDGIVLAAPREWLAFCEKIGRDWHLDKLMAIVPGGATSQESICAALEKTQELYGEEAVVLIHDGVRPLIDAETITCCIQCVRQHGSAITVSPQTETIMIRESDGSSCQIVDRGRCMAARAPQCFYLRDILSAHRRAQMEKKDSFIDSASLMQHYGYELHLVMGPAENIKITTVLDFRVFCALMDERGGAGA